MSFQNRTPESLVQRSDSKNPATTCRGTTSNGKACRRSLASPKSSPNPVRQSTSRGVIAVLEDDSGNPDLAAFYCWQHKDQAQNLANEFASPERRNTNSRIIPVEKRTSIDSLVARLGVASIQEQTTPTKKPREARKQYASRPMEPKTSYTPQYSRPENHVPTKPSTHKKREPGFWASLCCMSTADDDDDYLEVVKHKQRTQAPRPIPETTQIGNNTLQYPAPTRPRPLSQHQAASSTAIPLRKPMLEVPSQALNSRRTASAPGSTSNLLSFIPQTLSPQKTSALLNELSKPISPHDEAGYIYIFWLTETTTTPPKDTAASLLSPPSSGRSRRLSDVMTQYSGPTRTIKLKIGRANNVQRRMNEWNRQCGYNLSLVRFYPYVPSSSSSAQNSPASSSPGLASVSDLHLSRPPPERTVSDQVRKVPHAHRVERLVHLELADKRVIRDCAACGREHREWFEIEATQDGVKAVDEVVRRWVRWAESTPKDI